MRTQDTFAPATLPARLSDIPLRWARQAPQSPALHQDGVLLSYGELAAAVQTVAQQLRAQGVRPGDRVMLVAENCIAQIVLIFAIAHIDAWVVDVNARLSDTELDAIRAHCQARICLYMAGISPNAQDHGARHGARPFLIPGIDTLTGGDVTISALNPGCEPEPVYEDGRDQVAALIYTTGTTGNPKGVMLTHHNLLFIAATSSGVRKLTPLDRAYGVLPITHVFGLASMALSTLYAGACLYLAQRYTPAALIKAIDEDQLTILQGVPAMYARLLEYDYGDWKPVKSRLRFLYAGGSPLDPTLKQNVEKLFGLTLSNGYGLTEASPTVSQTPADAPRSDTSVGFVVPGVEIRIVNAQCHDVATGETGELWVRGPNVMKGYYRDPALTRLTIDSEGWLNTGDLARQDTDGALFLIGRTKELIIHSGFNVYPVEVETALNAHPAVVQSAVVGRTMPNGNEEVIAFVELDPAAGVTDTQALKDWLATRLSPYKRPSMIVAMKAMPAAATGKILKGQLRTLAQKMDC